MEKIKRTASETQGGIKRSESNTGFIGAQNKAKKRRSEGLPEPAAKKIKEVSQKDVVWIDESGEQLVVAYNEATQEERDNIWRRLATYAQDLRTQMKTQFTSAIFCDYDLDLVSAERYASLLPTLLQNNGPLRIRKQQEGHMLVNESAILPYLRKMERAVSETQEAIKTSESRCTKGSSRFRTQSKNLRPGPSSVSFE